MNGFTKAIRAFAEFAVGRRKRQWNRARGLFSKGYKLCDKEQYESALQPLHQAVEIFDRFYSSSAQSYRAALYRKLVDAYMNLGDCEQAIHFCHKAVDLCLLMGSSDSTDTYTVLYCKDLGRLLASKGYFERSIETYELAIKLLEGPSGSGHPPSKASIYSSLGSVYGKAGKFDQQITYYRDAVKVLEQWYYPGYHFPILLPHYYYLLACALLEHGHLDQSRPYFKHAIEILESWSQRVELARCYFHLGLALAEDCKDESEEASCYFQQFVGIMAPYLTCSDEPNAEFLGRDYYNLGYAYCELGDFDKARTCTQMATDLLEKNTPTSRELSKCYHVRARVFTKQGDLDTTISYLSKAAEIEKDHGPGSSTLGNIYHDFGAIYCTLGDYNEAITYIRKAIAFRENQHQGCLRLKLAESYKLLGSILDDQGRYFQAIECYHKAIALSEEARPDYLEFELYQKLGIAVAALMK